MVLLIKRGRGATLPSGFASPGCFSTLRWKEFQAQSPVGIGSPVPARAGRPCCSLGADFDLP